MQKASLLDTNYIQITNKLYLCDLIPSDLDSAVFYSAVQGTLVGGDKTYQLNLRISLCPTYPFILTSTVTARTRVVLISPGFPGYGP